MITLSGQRLLPAVCYESPSRVMDCEWLTNELVSKPGVARGQHCVSRPFGLKESAEPIFYLLLFRAAFLNLFRPQHPYSEV